MPIATEDFLYVHMPKTGGIWVTKILLGMGGIKVPGLKRHAPAGDLASSWTEGRLMFGTVRDPWSWYVSLWCHLRAGRDGQMLLRALGQGDQSFEAFLRGATDPAVWMNAPQRFTAPWWDWPAGGDGLWSETFRAIYGHGQPIPEALIDQAQLTKGLGEMLSADLSSIPRQNTADNWTQNKPLPPGEPYTDELVQLVRDYDGHLAHRIGYTEPGSKLPRAVHWGGLPD